MTLPLRAVWLGTVPYTAAWSLQRALAQARRRGRIDADCLLLLEHPPVYTMGRSGSAEHLRLPREELIGRGAEYLDVDRGGSVTFHGPGQLIAYPVIDVATAFPLDSSAGCGDVIRYVRTLEAAVIDALDGLGVAGCARPPYTGVWTGDPPSEKIAAIGVKVAGGVSTHGIALNVTTDLAWFDHIVPCGIPGAGVTSLRRQGIRGVDVEVCAGRLAVALAGRLGRRVEVADAALTSLIGEHLRGERRAA